MLAAEQSTEMAEEDQHDGSLGPEVTEPSRRSGGVFELNVSERRDVHPPTVP